MNNCRRRSVKSEFLSDSPPMICERRSVGVLATLTVFAASVLIMLAHNSRALSAKDNEACLEGDSVSVQIADQLFSISRTQRPHITDTNSNSVWINQCSSASQERLSQPIEAAKFTITTRASKVEQEGCIQSAFGVQIFISRSYTPESASRRNFLREEAYVKERGNTLDDLPRIGDFLALPSRSFGNEPWAFMAAPGRLETPDGYPVVMNCHGRPIGDMGSLCSTSYAYSEGLTLRYRFWDGCYPMETWTEIVSTVRAFVRSLMVDETLPN